MSLYDNSFKYFNFIIVKCIKYILAFFYSNEINIF